MADIDIERKKKSPLPWVLGLLALAILAFLLMRSCGDDDLDPAVVPVTDTTVVTDTTTAVVPVLPPADTTTALPPTDTTTAVAPAGTGTDTTTAPAGAAATDTTPR